jgi:hypothetical protein
LDSSKTTLSTDTSSVSEKNNLKFSPNSFYSIEISKFENTEIKIDGDLNESVWKKIRHLDNFSEFNPGDNIKPEVETEAMMFYDNDNLYIAFICYDNDMSKLRKTLCERDKIYSDDFISINIDTYNESRDAYELIVNPYGIQGDLSWNVQNGEDDTYDYIWYSAAKVYANKWTVEVAIPFKSLRFPDKNIQTWQFHLIRCRPRENRYQYTYIPLSRDDPFFFTKACKLNGIKDIKGGKNIEILPYAISTQSGSISDYNNANSEFKNEKIKGDFGFNLKYGITSNVTADFAYNPDFSQIESDAGVITVNNPVAFSFTEKRPFFLEGASIFISPLFVVYTRSINNPEYAFRLTGKIGKTEFGVLSAYDKRTPFIIPFTQGSDFIQTDRKSLTNIFRVKQTLKNESYIGFMMTDRQVNKKGDEFFNVDGNNRTFGVDGKFTFKDVYSLDFQFMKYITKEINYPEYDNSATFDNGRHTCALDGEYFTGMQNYVKLSRSARHWNFFLSYRDVAPTGRREVGYMSVNDYREIATDQNYMFYPDSKVLLRIQPEIYSYIWTSYDGIPRTQFLQPSLYMQFVKQINVYMGILAVNNERYNNIFFDGARRAFINFNINTLKTITLGGYFEIGKYIIKSSDPTMGYGVTLNLWSTFKPFGNLVMQNNYSYYELEKGYLGEKIYAGYILRNTSSYNLNKDITLRLICEYNTFSGSFYVNPLASYKPNPFTIFYFGFTDMYNDTEIPNGLPKYILTDRQFFLKMQYLFRI